MARWTELIWSTQTVAPDDGSRTRRWELAPWTRATAAWDMDGVDEEPDPDGSVCDEISNPVLLSGEACPCARYPRWLGRRA